MLNIERDSKMLLVVIARKHNNDLASVNWAAKDVNTSTGHGFSGDQKRVMLYVGKGPSFKTRSRFRGHSPRLDAKIRQRRQSRLCSCQCAGSFPLSPGLPNAVPGPLQGHTSKGYSLWQSGCKGPCTPQVCSEAARPNKLSPKAGKRGGPGF